MSRWPNVRLGDVLQRSEDTVNLRLDIEYREITVRLWGKGVVERGRVIGAVAGGRRFVARAGQFIVSRIDARNGAMGLVPPALDGAVVSNDFPLFWVDEARLVRDYLGWLCMTQGFVDLCRRASEGTTNRVRLQEGHFLALEMPLPPVAEQRRVVARIEELARHVGEARGLRKQAAESARGLSYACAEAAFRRFQARFGCRTLKDVCITISDGDHNTPPFTEDGVRFIFVGNVSSGRLHFEKAKRVSEEYFRTLRPERIPRRGDVLYSAVGATLGIPAVVDTDEPFCFQRHVAIVKPDPRAVDSRFVWHMLSSRTVFEKAWASTTGSAQPTVPLRAIRALPVPVPPLDDQHEVVASLDALQTEVNGLERLQTETAAELDALLPAILDRAFKGEL